MVIAKRHDKQFWFIINRICWFISSLDIFKIRKMKVTAVYMNLFYARLLQVCLLYTYYKNRHYIVPKLCLWTHKTVGWMTKVCLLFHRTKSCQGLSNGLFISSKTNPLGRRTWFTRVRPNVQMVANWNGVI